MEDSDMSALKNNSCVRDNVQRNSFYPGKGIPKKPKSLWRFEASGRIIRSPVAAGGTVFMACDDNMLYAIDTVTGKEKWTFKSTDHIYSMPAYDNGRIFFCGRDSFTYSLDTATGEVLWKFETESSSDCSTAVLNDVVYFGTGDGFYALDAKSGKPIWINNYACDLEMSPALGNGMIYAGSNAGIICALDIKSGKIKWKYPEGENTYIEMNEMADALALSGDILCFTIKYNTYCAVNANTGKEIWTFEVEGGSWTHTLMAPAIADGKVIVHNCEKHPVWYGVDLKTGEEIWKFRGQNYRNESVEGTPCIAEGLIYIGTSEGFYALDLQTGKLRWKYCLWSNESISGNPAIEDGIIFFYSWKYSCLQAVKYQKSWLARLFG